MRKVRIRPVPTPNRLIPTYEHAGHLIAGVEPPPWLVPFLKWFAQALWYDRRLADIQSNPSVMRARQRALHEAASLAHQSLSGAIDRPLFEHTSGCPISSDLAPKLQDFVSFVGAAEASFARPDATTIRGRRRTLQGPTMSSRTLFAARFFELWTYFHGCEPGPQENVRVLQGEPYLRRVRAMTRLDIIQAAQRGRPVWLPAVPK
jgi:hypothetical protein